MYKNHSLDWTTDESRIIIGTDTLDTYGENSGMAGGKQWMSRVMDTANGKNKSLALYLEEGASLPLIIESKNNQPVAQMRFRNIFSINGQQVDADVSVTSVTVLAIGDAYESDSATADRDGLACTVLPILRITPKTIANSSTAVVTENGTTAGAMHGCSVRLSFRLYWHGSGETIPYPVIHSLDDIDAQKDINGTEIREGITLVSGYRPEAWHYPECELTFQGNSILSTDGTGSSGDDCWFRTGCQLLTEDGEFSMENTVSTFGNNIRLFFPYGLCPDPKKSVSEELLTEQGPLSWTITQELPRMTWAEILPYGGLAITDTLPDGFTYVSAKVARNGKDVTASQGTLSYDNGTRTLSWGVKPELLKDPDFYGQGALSLEIQGTAGPEGLLDSLENQSVTDADGITLRSGKASVRLRVPVSVATEGEGNTDILGNVKYYLPSTGKPENGGKAGIHIRPADGWYLKEALLDGKAFAVNLEGEQDVPYTGGPTGNSAYGFRAVFTRYLKITTSIRNGRISGNRADIMAGKSHTISWEPDGGYYVKYIELDGKRYSGKDLEKIQSPCTFTNIQEDHAIHVECAKIPVLTVTARTKHHVWAGIFGDFHVPVRIQGRTLSGDQVLLYRNLDLSSGNDSLSVTVPAEKYTVTLPGQDSMEGGRSVETDLSDTDSGEALFLLERAWDNRYVHQKGAVNRLRG